VERYGDVRVFGGYYYFDNEYGRNFSGGKARLEAQLTDHVILDVSWTQDQQIGSGNFYAGLRFSFLLGAGVDTEPSGRRGLFEGIMAAINHREPRKRSTLESQINQNIIRNEGVHFTQSGNIGDPARSAANQPPRFRRRRRRGRCRIPSTSFDPGPPSRHSPPVSSRISSSSISHRPRPSPMERSRVHLPISCRRQQLAGAMFQQTGKLQTIYVIARPGMTYSDVVSFTTPGTQIALLDSSVTLQNSGGGPALEARPVSPIGTSRSDRRSRWRTSRNSILGGFNITADAGPATLINNVPGNTFQFVGGTNLMSSGGPALSVANSHVEGSFASLTSSNSATTGLSLTNVTGNLSVANLSVTNPAGAGIDIENSSVNFTAGNVSVSGSGGAGIKFVNNLGSSR
jgi:hypothetical protein